MKNGTFTNEIPRYFRKINYQNGKKKVSLTALSLAMSLGFMTTIAGCEINPDGGGEGGEGGEEGSVIEQPEYEGGEGGESGEN